MTGLHWRTTGDGEHNRGGLPDRGLQAADSRPGGADGQDGGSLPGLLPVCLWGIYQQDCRTKRPPVCRCELEAV